MRHVSVRDLRNHGGDVLDRVAAGEAALVTRDGTPVAEIRPLPRRALSVGELRARRSNLRAVDADALRRELDDIIDPTL